MKAREREDVKRLYTIMREWAKPIAKRSISKVLGAVGKENFERDREQRGWKRLRYTLKKGWKKNIDIANDKCARLRSSHVAGS